MIIIYIQDGYEILYKGISGSGIASPKMENSLLHSYVLLKEDKPIKYYNTNQVMGTGPYDSKKEHNKAIDVLKKYIV